MLATVYRPEYFVAHDCVENLRVRRIDGESGSRIPRQAVRARVPARPAVDTLEEARSRHPLCHPGIERRRMARIDGERKDVRTRQPRAARSPGSSSVDCLE